MIMLIIERSNATHFYQN